MIIPGRLLQEVHRCIRRLKICESISIDLAKSVAKVIAVIGAQWGDEGKGKIVDLLAERFDIVARYQGGHNAGHSVQVGDQSFVLHLLPSGIVHRGKTCVLGNGMVIDPKASSSKRIDSRNKASKFHPSA